MVAALAVLLVAGSALIVTLFASRGTPSAAPGGEVTAAPALLPTLAVTSNLYARASRGADLVAVIPAGREARVTGRTDDSTWLRVVYPPEASIEGWVPRANFVAATVTEIDALPVVASEQAPAASANADAGGTPDLAVAGAEVLPDGTLSVRLSNVGRGPVSAKLSLQVSGGDGAILGVLEVDLTQGLAPGRTAAVNTGIVIRRAGLYVIEVDRANAIAEMSETNNTRRVLLLGGGN